MTPVCDIAFGFQENKREKFNSLVTGIANKRVFNGWCKQDFRLW